jgi:hypothetical protein
LAQREALLNRVSETSSLSEAKGVVYATREMRRLGYELEDVSLHYRGSQGLDLVFSKEGQYAIAEAKHGQYLSSLETYAGGLRQGSLDYKNGKRGHGKRGQENGVTRKTGSQGKRGQVLHQHIPL